MTQIDFYILPTDSDNARLHLACRIADKAMQRGEHVFINAPSEPESRRLDELLWTFSQGSFVPHRVVAAGETAPSQEPVLIGCGQEPCSERWNLMINLATDVPEFFSRYERVAEVIDSDRQRREQGRERYRFYRDRGYELKTHQM